jgi:cell division septum initiation protein DivIVA
MEGQVNRLVKDVLKKADIATNDDVKALKREIQGLKKELKAAKSGKSTSPRAKSASNAKTKTKPAS